MSTEALHDVTAALLAGGLGTRLRAAVADRPKVLAEVDGRPFLALLLERLAEAGVHRAVLCTGHMADQVEAALGHSFAGMALDYSREAEPLGTGGALRLAASRLDSGLVLALNGDSFCGVDLRAFARAHREAGVSASLVVVRVPDAAPFGRVAFDETGRVTRFEEKKASAGPGWVNAGVYLLARTLLLRTPEGRAVSLERELFPAWIGDLHAFPASEPFIDIGTPESYHRAMGLLRQGRLP